MIDIIKSVFFVFIPSTFNPYKFSLTFKIYRNKQLPPFVNQLYDALNCSYKAVFTLVTNRLFLVLPINGN